MLSLDITIEELRTYIGRKARILESCPDWLIYSKLSDETLKNKYSYYGDPNNLERVVEIIDTVSRIYCRGSHAIYVKHPISNSEWGVALDHFELIDDVQVIVNPYPHNCKLCYNSGRRIGSNFLCSNDHCKSRIRFKQNYNKPIKINIGGGTQNDTILITCKNCGEQSNDMVGSCNICGLIKSNEWV